MPSNLNCPCCGAPSATVFYETGKVPVHSVRLLNSRAAAFSTPMSRIALASCSACGFIFNSAFDPSVLRYDDAYESTQSHSPTFNRFSQSLAARLMEDYDLHGKTILEIGCGQGEFLGALCRLGGSWGIGFDPAFDESRSPGASDPALRFFAENFSDRHTNVAADFVCCKMTLEHVAEPAKFMVALQEAFSRQPPTVLFLQVPDTTRILRDMAFWDIYYEHCSYFTAESLQQLVERHGFEVSGCRVEYDDQYLMVEARSGGAPNQKEKEVTGAGQATSELVANFGAKSRSAIEDWRQRLTAWQQAGKRVVIWGAGSKAVAFLTTLGAGDQVAYAIDVNPLKWGSYLAGSGHAVYAPEQASTEPPDVVIAMNPIYRDEIAAQLADLGISAELICL